MSDDKQQPTTINDIDDILFGKEQPSQNHEISLNNNEKDSSKSKDWIIKIWLSGLIYLFFLSIFSVSNCILVNLLDDTIEKPATDIVSLDKTENKIDSDTNAPIREDNAPGYL